VCDEHHIGNSPGIPGIKDPSLKKGLERIQKLKQKDPQAIQKLQQGDSTTLEKRLCCMKQEKDTPTLSRVNDYFSTL
jgi:hypothetical protein